MFELAIIIILTAIFFSLLDIGSKLKDTHILLGHNNSGNNSIIDKIEDGNYDINQLRESVHDIKGTLFDIETAGCEVKDLDKLLDKLDSIEGCLLVIADK